MGYGIWDMGYGIWDMGYGLHSLRQKPINSKFLEISKVMVM